MRSIWKLMMPSLPGVGFVHQKGFLPFLLPAIIGGATSAIGAKKSADASKDLAKDQNAANLEQAKLQNKYNLDMYNLQRGSDGNAVLPLYFGDREKQQGDDIISRLGLFDQTVGGAQGQIDAFNANRAAYAPAREAATGIVNEVLGGGVGARKGAYYDSLDASRKGQSGSLLADFFERSGRQDNVDSARTLGGQVVGDTILSGLQPRQLARDSTVRADARDLLPSAYRGVLDQEVANIGTINDADAGRADLLSSLIATAGKTNLNRLRSEQAGKGLGLSTVYANSANRSSIDSQQQAALEKADARMRSAERLAEVNLAAPDMLAAQLAQDTAAERYQSGLDTAYDVSGTEEAVARIVSEGRVQNALDRREMPTQASANLAGQSLIEEILTARDQGSDAELATRLSLLDAPYNMEQRDNAQNQLLLQQLLDPVLQGQQALDFYRIGEGRAPNATPLPAPAVAPSSGLAIGNALTGVGSNLLQDALPGLIAKLAAPKVKSGAPEVKSGAPASNPSLLS